MGAVVAIRELRQNLSRYIERVKAGESLVVTERGNEVARLIPLSTDAYAELAARFGTTVPTTTVEQVAAQLELGPTPAGATDAFLAESRGERAGS